LCHLGTGGVPSPYHSRQMTRSPNR
jgi:hypothetical protein